MYIRILNQLKNINDWFFLAFLASFFLSIRKVIFFYPINGIFNEYSGIYLYLSDIFLSLTILAWSIILLYNKYIILSIDSHLGIKQFIHSNKLWKSFYPHTHPGNLLSLISLLLVIWSFLSIIWSENTYIALFRSIKLLEFYLLFVYVKSVIVPRGTIVRQMFKIIIGVGLINSIIAIIQFAGQKSIGLNWLKESLLSSDIPGVAEIIFNQETLIRGYGLFAHPNILGGFLLLSIILTLGYSRLFYQGRIVPRGTMLDIAGGILDKPSFTLLTILLVQIIGLLVTFSRSAIIGLILASVYIIVPRGTSKLSKISELFHMKQFIFVFILLLIVVISLFSFKPDLIPFQSQSLHERAIFSNVSRETIGKNFVLGVGSGNFVWNYSQKQSGLENWMYQPVHNVFLLVWSELGLIGLLIIIWILWKIFYFKKDVQPQKEHSDSEGMFHVEHHKRQTQNTLYERCEISHAADVKYSQNENLSEIKLVESQIPRVFKGILLGLIFIMLFDHYLWDIQQGQIMLWLVLGIIASSTKSYHSDIISL